MLPRAHSGSTSTPPEEWLIRRVVSERDALAQLHSQVIAMEAEPTSWFAPSQAAYRQRLGGLGEELGRAVAATDSLVLSLQYEREQWRRSLVAVS